MMILYNVRISICQIEIVVNARKKLLVTTPFVLIVLWPFNREIFNREFNKKVLSGTILSSPSN